MSKTSSSQPEKLENYFVSVTLLLENGLIKVLFRVLELQEETDFTMSMHTSKKIVQVSKQSKKNKKSVTVESHLKDKKMTLPDKSNSCNQVTQTTQSSQTLDQASTSEGKVSTPFWSWLAKDLSPKLWLPIETDSVDLPSNSLKGSFNLMESNSWFSMKVWTPQDKVNWQKTCCPSLTFSTPELTASGNTPKKRNRLRKSNKPIANKSRRIRLFPNSETFSKLKQWFGCVRKTYNMSLESINKKESKINIIELRKKFINAESIPNDCKYLLDTPKHVRDGAIEDLVSAFQSNFTKKQKDPEFKFDVKFRSKKDDQSIKIPQEAIKLILSGKSLKMYPTYLTNQIKFNYRKRDENKLNPDINYSCRMILDKLGRIYLSIPFRVEACDNQASKVHWVSIDPGVRNFLTLYSPQGECYQIGSKDISRIYRLCLCLDKIRNNKASYRLKKRIKNLVNEVHWKAIHFITNKFENIILPKFQIQQMIKKASRKLSKKSVRQMVCWRHYTFQQRLLNTGSLRGCKIFITTEEYTSKTCTHCLQIYQKLGGKKMFECPNCKVKIDRDVVGSRNIFLKSVKGNLDIASPEPGVCCKTSSCISRNS